MLMTIVAGAVALAAGAAGYVVWRRDVGPWLRSRPSVLEWRLRRGRARAVAEYAARVQRGRAAEGRHV